MGAPIADKRRDIRLVGREYDPKEGGSSRNVRLVVGFNVNAGIPGHGS